SVESREKGTQERQRGHTDGDGGENETRIGDVDAGRSYCSDQRLSALVRHEGEGVEVIVKDDRQAEEKDRGQRGRRHWPDHLKQDVTGAGALDPGLVDQVPRQAAEE